jgi:carbon starvation protein
VGAWGYFLYRGVIDPLGGVNTLWPLFGISNQMLAAIALTLCTVVLFKMKRQRYAWVTALPTLWLMTCTLVAGWQKLFHANPAIGFLAHAGKVSAALSRGEVLGPAKALAEMRSVILNDYVGAALCCAFMAVVVSMLVYGVLAIRKALANPAASTREIPDDLQSLDRVGI